MSEKQEYQVWLKRDCGNSGKWLEGRTFSTEMIDSNLNHKWSHIEM